MLSLLFGCIILYEQFSISSGHNCKLGCQMHWSWYLSIFKILTLLDELKKKEFWQKSGLRLGYPDHFPTAVTITPQSQQCLWLALNCTYFMRHWFWPTCLIHLAGRKYLNFENKLEWRTCFGLEKFPAMQTKFNISTHVNSCFVSNRESRKLWWEREAMIVWVCSCS